METSEQSTDGELVTQLTLSRKVFLNALKDAGAEFGYLNDNDLLNLAEGTIKAINKSISEGLDCIFFLDKSARPAAYLFLRTWQSIFGNLKRPQIRFINIGRDQVYHKEPLYTQFDAIFYRINKELRGKRVGIYDEYSLHYSAIRLAQDLFLKKIPDATSFHPLVMFAKPPTWIINRSSGDWAVIGVYESKDSLFTKPTNDGLK